MRYLLKRADEPVALREYVEAQQPVGHGLDYRTFSQTRSPRGGSRGGELRKELVAEQSGLCAYTGAGIDERLGRLSEASGKLKFSVHNEHLKPQSVCMREMEAAGQVYGESVGEDMNHRNIVAALLVGGAGGGRRVSKADLFGAAHREDDGVPLLPTDPSCETRLRYDAQGGVSAAQAGDEASSQTIRVLNLDNGTLAGWRRTAIDVFTSVIRRREDAEDIIEKTTVPEKGRLPEYCFAIRQVAQLYLDLANEPPPNS